METKAPSSSFQPDQSCCRSPTALTQLRVVSFCEAACPFALASNRTVKTKSVSYHVTAPPPPAAASLFVHLRVSRVRPERPAPRPADL